MKKFLFIALLCVLATSSIFAQLKVKENGQIEIGIEPEYSPDFPQENLDIFTKLKIYGIMPNGASGKMSFGDQLSKWSFNVVVGELGNDDSDRLWLHGKMGTYITAYPGSNDTVCFYDIDKGNFFKFNHDVHTSGVFISSDRRFKDSIAALDESLSGIHKLKGISYKLKPQVNYSTFAETSGKALTEKEKRDNAFFKKVAEREKNVPARYGFIAQDVKEIFPELVHTDNSGYMYVDYIGMIPLLVNAINELKDSYEAEITTLNDKIEDIQNGKDNTQIASDGKIEKDIVPALFQNSPNPFSVSTKINYTLPYTVRQADIYIYDMQGQQIRKIEVTDRGASSITIQGSELPAGMYIYSLIADNCEIDSKRMILTQ